MHPWWWTRVTRVSEMARNRIAMARESSRRSISRRGKRIVTRVNRYRSRWRATIRATIFRHAVRARPTTGSRPLFVFTMTIITSNYVSFTAISHCTALRRWRKILLSTGPLYSLSVRISARVSSFVRKIIYETARKCTLSLRYSRQAFVDSATIRTLQDLNSR